MAKPFITRSVFRDAVLFFLVVGCLKTSVFAQTTYSWVNPSSGAWTTASNWSPAGVPSSGDRLVLNAPSGSITISAIPSITLRSISVAAADSSYKVVLSGNTSTLSIDDSVSVVEGGIEAGSGMTLIFKSGSSYKHRMNGGRVPVATWQANSACEVTGITTAMSRGFSQNFYNFLLDSPGQTGLLNMGPDNFPTGIDGVCKFGRTGISSQVNWKPPATVVWNGDLELAGGRYIVLNTGNVAAAGENAVTYSIDFTIRDLIMTAEFPEASTNSNRLLLSNNSITTVSLYLRITRDLMISGHFLDYNGIGTNNVEVRLGRHFTMTGGKIGAIQTDIDYSTGNSHFYFAGTTQQNINISGNSTIYSGRNNRHISFAALSGSIVNFATPFVTNGGNYIDWYVEPGATIMIPDADGISTMGTLTGSIRNTHGSGSPQTMRSFSPGATYIYSGSVNQVTGSGLPPTVKGLGVNSTAPGGVSLSNVVRVDSALILQAGRLITGAFDLTVGESGVVSGNPSTASFVAADQTGRLVRNVPVGASVFTFPVGDAAGNYSPFTLDLRTNVTPGSVGVTVTNMAAPDVNTPNEPDSWLSRYWTLSNSGITDYTYTGAFGYPQAAVSPIINFEPALKVSRWNGTNNWLEVLESSASNGILSINAQNPLSQENAPLSGIFTGRVYKAVFIGIDSVTDEREFNVFPNPATDAVMISFGQTIVSGTVKLVDLAGRVLRSSSVNGSSGQLISFQTADLATGIYTIAFEGEAGKMDFKLVIVH